MRPRWRFLNTGAADGPSNMAVDEAILRAVNERREPPTVRIYVWHPPAISVGYAQHVDRDIDLDRCEHRHLTVVRRLTGGRAVLHDEEVTYAVTAPEDDPCLGQSVQETYLRIGRALICGLRHLGVEADLQRISTGSGRNPSCFSSTGRYEVVVGGKKLIGSAQRRLDGVILQHGSLLTGNGYRRLGTFLNISNHQTSCQSAVDHVTTLSEILGAIPPFDRMADALHRGFEEAFDCQLIAGEVSKDERAMSQRLKAERYECESWNLHRSGFRQIVME